MPIEKGTQMEYRLETIIEQEGERQIFLFEGSGQIVRMGEWLYLRYQEEGTDNKVTIKLSQAGKMTIIRRAGNELSSRMSFETSGKGSALLPTPAGMLEMETTTHRLFQQYQEKPFAGTVQLDYTIGNADQLLGKYGISLHFTT